MCLYPKLIYNRKYKENKKNQNIVPAVNDPRVLLVPIGCGDCIECRKQKAREWQVRLAEDIKTNKNGLMITLTFSTQSIIELREEYKTFTDKKTKEKYTRQIKELEGYDQDNAIATIAIRRFNERWRKEHKKAIRHWLVTELGHNGTENIHLHGIIWTTEQIPAIAKIWKYGYIWPRTEHDRRKNYVNARTVNYIVKYINKKDAKHKTYKPVILTSPGIGHNYTTTHNATNNKFKNNNTDETYQTNTGHKISLPIYWRNKIYNDSERETLWLQKLDKNIRWVCGEKIKANNTEELHKLLEYHRKRQKELGYGDGDLSKKWKRAEYEKHRRKLVQEYRIKNASGGVLAQDIG